MDECHRIDRLRVRELTLPFRTPFRVSQGTLHNRRSLIVELESDGCIGYGESAPCEEPFYSEETLGTVRTLYEELFLPRLHGRVFESLADFDRELRRGVRGNPFARAGLENAYWDLCCAKSGVPLVEAIGTKLGELGVASDHRAAASAIESGVALGIPDDEDSETLRRWIVENLEQGYRRLKIKVRPGWDTAACSTARAAAGDEFPLWTDANASFELERDRRALHAMDEFGLLFHEQPLHHRDLLDHARLGREIRTPLCLDESLTDVRAGRAALELGAASIWNVKVQRVGGLGEALELYRLAVERGARLWGGTMPESGIGAQAILALAAFPAFSYPADVEPSERWYRSGCDPLEIFMGQDGRIEVPRTCGIGQLIDKKLYARSSRLVLSTGVEASP